MYRGVVEAARVQRRLHVIHLDDVTLIPWYLRGESQKGQHNETEDTKLINSNNSSCVISELTATITVVHLVSFGIQMATP